MYIYIMYIPLPKPNLNTIWWAVQLSFSYVQRLFFNETFIYNYTNYLLFNSLFNSNLSLTITSLSFEFQSKGLPG